MSDTTLTKVTEDTNALAARLSDLWDAERCDWNVKYEARFYSNPPSWVCHLEWTQEGGSSPHGADWTTYDWAFYGESADEALAEAVRWAEELAPLKPCGECDGNGSWNGVTCADCGGSGLEAGPRAGSTGQQDSRDTDERGARG